MRIELNNSARLATELSLAKSIAYIKMSDGDSWQCHLSKHKGKEAMHAKPSKPVHIVNLHYAVSTIIRLAEQQPF